MLEVSLTEFKKRRFSEEKEKMLFSTALLLTSSKMWSFSMWSTSRSVISPVMEVIGREEDFLRKCCQSQWLKLCLNTDKLFELGI